MKARQFSLQDFISGDDEFHLARVTIHSRQDLPMHNHFYAEIFWIENGSGYHLINGQKIRIKPGHLVLVRPWDQHTFTSTKQGLTIMNVAFSMETFHFLQARYFPDQQVYFGAISELPFQIDFDPSVVRCISKMADEMWQHRNSKIHLDSLLLFIFRQIISTEKGFLKQNIPFWLQNALLEFTTPEKFKGGVSCFATLCDRNIDHINRVVRKNFGKTLSDLINEQRITFAAKQLSLTGNPIKNIIADCGFTNSGHFYKIFKETMKQTPMQYRKNNQTIV